MVTETDKKDIKDSIDALVEKYEDRVAELESENSSLEDRVSELEDELAERPGGIQEAVEAIFSAVGNESPSAGEVDSPSWKTSRDCWSPSMVPVQAIYRRT